MRGRLNPPADRETISLRDLLRTGRFGRVRDDIRPAEVAGILGEPSRYEVTDAGPVFRFGNYELAFFEGTPMYLMNDGLAYRDTGYFRNDKIKIDPDIFGRRDPLTKPEVAAYLSSIDAGHRDVIWNGHEVARTNSGVILDFGPDPDGRRTVCTGIWRHFPEFPSRVRPDPRRGRVASRVEHESHRPKGDDC